MRRRRQVGLCLSLLLYAAAAGGCSPHQGPDNPYQKEFDSFLVETSSDLVRAVLKDGVITDAEMQAANEGWLTCMHDAGFEAWLEGSGRTFKVFDSCSGSACDAYRKRADSVSMECDVQYLAGVEELYNKIRRNPNNEDEFTIVRDCLVRSGLLPESANPDDVSPAFDDGTLDMADLEVEACLRNPKGIPELD